MLHLAVLLTFIFYFNSHSIGNKITLLLRSASPRKISNAEEAEKTTFISGNPS